MAKNKHGGINFNFAKSKTFFIILAVVFLALLSVFIIFNIVFLGKQLSTALNVDTKTSTLIKNFDLESFHKLNLTR